MADIDSNARSALHAPMADNAGVIDRELAWLDRIMAARFAHYGNAVDVDAGAGSPSLPPPPVPAGAPGPYAATILRLGLDPIDRLVLALALTPYVAPALLDPFLLHNDATKRRFTEFGGVIGQSHAGFLPTVETALFLIAGDVRRQRLLAEPRLDRENILVRRGLILMDHRHPEEPPFSAMLRMTPAGLHELLRGEDYAPQPGADFPATLVTTKLDWDDLVLDKATLRQIDLVARWIAHAKTLMGDPGLSRRLKPGYRCLFHGTPGTGKTLTACLLGKRHNLPVYRVDISRVVSKWIGETEKNLAALFDQASNRDWILFFDEADALFGKRTETQSANDRAANQQIAYLLQRLEDHPGVAILATNLHSHIDEAFARRFQSMVRFAMPGPDAREALWRASFETGAFTLAEDVNFETLAMQHELAGGAIINVLRHASLMAIERRPPVVHNEDLLEGIRRELQKEHHYVSR